MQSFVWYLGGSLLGSVSMTTVTIAKSDYPNGMFGFRGPLEIIRENPARQEQTTLTIERSGGHQGQQTVSLKVIYFFIFALWLIVNIHVIVWLSYS